MELLSLRHSVDCSQLWSGSKQQQAAQAMLQARRTGSGGYSLQASPEPSPGALPEAGSIGGAAAITGLPADATEFWGTGLTSPGRSRAALAGLNPGSGELQGGSSWVQEGDEGIGRAAAASASAAAAGARRGSTVRRQRLPGSSSVKYRELRGPGLVRVVARPASAAAAAGGGGGCAGFADRPAAGAGSPDGPESTKVRPSSSNSCNSRSSIVLPGDSDWSSSAGLLMTLEGGSKAPGGRQQM